MTDPVTFALAVLALLATPGPTNTLLATSGATAGLRRSLPLIIAEISGYMISISVLSLVVGPLVRASPVLGMGLRVACGLYLIYVAVKLWREGGDAFTSDKPVSFPRVFVATLLNPKAIVFAFVIVPFLGEGAVGKALPYMAALAGMIVSVALCWISAGAVFRAATSENVGRGVVRRTGAVVLGVFATLIVGSVLRV
jgi:threonine/homoserine/homoserine lactone efflux protein